MRRQLVVLIVMLLPLVADAKIVQIDGISYELVSKTKEAEVQSQSNKYSGSVVIPASVTYDGEEYVVTAIRKYAFYECSNLTSITIPNSVKSMGELAFGGCNNLTAVHISDLEAWCSIAFSSGDGNPLVYAHRLFLNGEEIKDLVIPEGVTSIAACAFWGCSGLTSVTIPSSMTSISPWAFQNCNNLTAVHISDLEAWCRIDFKNSMNPLENAHHLFLNGEEVRDLIIPDGLTIVGDRTFCGCTGLTSVSIPESVTTIGSCAFQSCSGLTSITIPNSVTSINELAFRNCSSLTSVTIPSSVTSIGERAFQNCTALTSVSISSGLTIIEEGVFSYCYGLTSVSIPESVKTIGNGAFMGCGLTSITIPSSITSIRENAFQGCSGLIAVHITDLEAWCKIAFHSSTFSNPLYYAHRLFLNGEEITELEFPSSVTSIGAMAFYCCNGLTSVTIPSSVTSIGGGAFRSCNSLTTVTIQDGVSRIGTYAFCECIDLDSITIGDGLTSIGLGAFWGCRCLTSITIPNSVKTIEDAAFKNCERLASITIGSGVQEIQFRAFESCMSLADVFCYAEKVPLTNYQAFYHSSYRNATLHVPEASVEAYKVAETWKDFKSIVPLTDVDGVPSIHRENAEVSPICDLHGRRLNAKPSKGLYIRDGRKMVVK